MIAFLLPGGFPIYIGALLLGLGGSAGLAWAYRRTAPRMQQSVLPGGLWFLVGCLAGGRLGYAITNWGYFAGQPAEIARVSLGGLSGWGALTGGILAAGMFAAWQRISFPALMDALVPLFVALAVCTWMVCWISGWAYGAATGAWWGLPAPDEFGIVTRRVPVQLLGAAAPLALFAMLDMIDTIRRVRGGFSAAWLTGVSLIYLLLSLLRADPAPYWANTRSDTILAGVSLAASLALLAAVFIPAYLHKRIAS